MDDKRNLIIAVVLTAIVLFGWPFFAEKFLPQPEKPPVVAGKDGAAKDTAADGAPTAADSEITDAPAATKTVTLPAALKASGRVQIESPKLKGSINLAGARIDDLLLIQHREALPKDSPPVRLYSPAGTKGAYFARFGWVGKNVVLPDANTIWSVRGEKLTPKTPVTLSWTNPAGQKFDIAYSIDENYLITAKQTFTNTAALPAANNVQVAPFGLINRNGKSDDVDSWNIHIGPMGVFDGSANYDIDYANLDGEEPGFFSRLFGNTAKAGVNSFDTTGGWVGFTDKYWLSALVPDQKTEIKARLQANSNYQAHIVSSKQTTVAAGKSMSQTSHLFAGAKEVEVLNDYTSRLGIKYLDYSIDWGWFWFIAIPFFWILHWLFGFFGNFGVAIIGLTVIVRAILFPLAQKQFKSMAQMRVVQPKMKEIQDRFKDDKPRQQQEIMKLYKEEKVNPLAGCFPIVLQIPIFFALYKLLMLSIEMRHQPFVLWLKDLSAPDPFMFGLFPDLGLPSFLAIGFLPIMLGVTMWLMQRLNPQPMDEVQKQVFAIMPWFLMFIMAPFAAGLQLYWVVSNLISIGQQKLLYARHPVLKQQMAKEKEAKA